ncbi:hypothetical protein B0H12DRAFT_1141715 [Mycena haematopus]|nr:hypothetical protein B0H12DRAFT_1141715 [Mycena haematopus]
MSLFLLVPLRVASAPRQSLLVGHGEPILARRCKGRQSRHLVQTLLECIGRDRRSGQEEEGGPEDKHTDRGRLRLREESRQATRINGGTLNVQKVCKYFRLCDIRRLEIHIRSTGTVL